MAALSVLKRKSAFQTKTADPTALKRLRALIPVDQTTAALDAPAPLFGEVTAAAAAAIDAGALASTTAAATASAFFVLPLLPVRSLPPSPDPNLRAHVPKAVPILGEKGLVKIEGKWKARDGVVPHYELWFKVVPPSPVLPLPSSHRRVCPGPGRKHARNAFQRYCQNACGACRFPAASFAHVCCVCV